jgi:hypothetical protein
MARQRQPRQCWIILLISCAFILPASGDPPANAQKNIFDMSPDKPATRPAAGQNPPPAASATAAKSPATSSPATPLPTSQQAATQPSAATEPAVIQRMRIPSEIELVAANSRIDELFGKDIAAARTADKKLDLAEALISTAVDEKRDHAAQFQALITARDLAVKAQDFHLACQAIAQLAERFYVDRLAYEAEAAAELRRTPIPMTDRRLFCLQVESISQSLSAQGRFDLIPGLDEIARSVAASTDESSLVRQARKYADAHTTAQAMYAALAGARQTLSKDPANGPANTAIGKYECFEQDDWEHGLPHLAAGSDADLKQAAQSDGSNASADQKALLANAWWEIAQAQPEAEKQRILNHIGPLYLKALPDLDGFQKESAIKRLVVIRSAMLGEPTAVDLLDLVDVSRDTVVGEWKVSHTLGLLTSASSTDSRITFLYHPPREYEYRVVFTRVDGNGGIDLFCLGGEGDRQFRYTLGGFGNTVAAFGLVQAESARSNFTTIHNFSLENQKRCTLLVRVRSDGVQAFLNDKPLAREFFTDFRDLGLYPETQLNRLDVIGLMTSNSKFIIHSAYIAEISGHGHRVAADDPVDSPAVASATYSGPANNRRPFLVTLHANGTVDSTIGMTAVWFIHGNQLAFRWGDDIDTCKLSADRKSFIGKTSHGERVKGEITDGGV